MELMMKSFMNTNNTTLLRKNILFISTFVLLYEELRSRFTECVKKKLCTWHIDNNANESYIETDEYKELIKDRKINGDKNILLNTISWFVDQKAIVQSDYDTFIKIRDKRNIYAHEMSGQLCRVISESDIQLFSKLILLYQKMNSWWDKEIDKIGNIAASVSIADMILGNLFSDSSSHDFYCKEIIEWHSEYVKSA
jgi:hypothetical protein